MANVSNELAIVGGSAFIGAGRGRALGVFHRRTGRRKPDCYRHPGSRFDARFGVDRLPVKALCHLEACARRSGSMAITYGVSHIALLLFTPSCL